MPLDKIVEIREILRVAVSQRPEIDDNFGAAAEAFGAVKALTSYAFIKIKQLEADLKAEKANGQ